MRVVGVVFALCVAGCEPHCTGNLIAPDVVVTALHCTSGLQLAASTLPRPAVHVGDELHFWGLCSGPARGRVLTSDGGLAELTVSACPGDSGAPVWDADGQVVGTVTARRLDTGAALVRLF